MSRAPAVARFRGGPPGPAARNEPVHVSRGPVHLLVQTKADHRGGNVFVKIARRSGEVRGVSVLTR